MLMAEKQPRRNKEYVKSMNYKDLAGKYEISINTIRRNVGRDPKCSPAVKM